MTSSPAADSSGPTRVTTGNRSVPLVAPPSGSIWLSELKSNGIDVTACATRSMVCHSSSTPACTVSAIASEARRRWSLLRRFTSHIGPETAAEVNAIPRANSRRTVVEAEVRGAGAIDGPSASPTPG